MKKRSLGNYLFWIVSAIVFFAGIYLLFSFPAGLVLDLFWDKMDAEDLEELDYNHFLIAGLPAGEGIERIENREQFDAITLGEHFAFFTFETDSVIPLDAYQLKSTEDVYNNSYRVGHYRKNSKKKWPVWTDDWFQILWKRNRYNRYYLVALPDENYVVVYLDDAYYLKYLLTRKVQLPVGYVTYMSNNEEEILQSCLEPYGLEEEKVIVMHSQQRYEDYKIWYKIIPLIVFIGILTLYWGIVTICVSVLKRRGKPVKEIQEIKGRQAETVEAEKTMPERDKMDKTYDYDEKNNTLRIYMFCGIQDFCWDHKIKLEEFNLPVLLDDSITNCVQMFSGCSSFNQPVVIPERVTGCMDMFRDCKSLNQPVKIPDNVVQCARMFTGCSSFNQAVELPKGALYCYEMFARCESFNQKIELPLHVENISAMFSGCSSFDQEIVLSDNIVNCGSMFANCVSLNQKIEIHSTNCFYNNMFLNCTSLHPENVTIYSGRIMQKTLEKRLRQMWGRDESEDIADIMEKVNVVKVKTAKKLRITGISYTLEGDHPVEMEEEEIAKLTSLEIHQKLEELYSTRKLTALEISERSASSMKTLAVYFDNELFAIGVIDEWNDSVSYYNSGEGKEPVEIRGNLYPKHMVTGDHDILFLIIDDFLKTGKPSKQVKWTRG